jgi:ribosomal protein L40E
MLAGKIDAVLGSRSERIRRNSLLFLLMAVGCFIGSSRGGWLGWLLLALAILILPAAFWEYLVYRRSLVLGKDFERLPVPAHDDYLLTLKLNDAPVEPVKELPVTKTKKQPDSIYCPSCGANNPSGNKYCRSCRWNILAIQKSMRTSWLRATLDSWLDRSLKWHYKREGSAQALGFIMMLFASTNLESGLAHLRTNDLYGVFELIASFVLFVTGIWDSVYFRRRRSTNPEFSDDKEPGIQSSESEPEVPTTNDLSLPERLPHESPHSVTEATTRQLEVAASREQNREV